MHIIENYFDVCGFDHRLVQGGTSVYIWNLARSFAARGHRVSVVTPAHGRLPDIRQYHDVTTLPYEDEYALTIPLDRRVWRDFPDEAVIRLRTTAHRISIDGVDLYFLSNDLLDQLPETFYPPYDAKGRDLVFYKPLAFQVDSVRFVRDQFADERVIIHAHEPFYHYLVPAAFADDPDKLVVSTVQSNMPITKMVYRPEVERLLDLLGAKTPLPPVEPAPSADPGETAMRQYQQLTHLHYEYPPDHVNVFTLVAEHADLLDFLSPGQLDFYSTFADTPFEQLFTRLPVADVVRRNAHKRFVGWCALSDRWLDADPAAVDRAAVLAGLGLDPALTTFFHNARYATHHKGQVELMRAIDAVLNEGVRANFIVRCLSGTGIGDDYFHDVARRHRGRVHLEWAQVPEEQIFGYAASSDFCVFPSKFEMDTFLIAQGEAMACGAVPIATAQQGMAHFNHVADPLRGPSSATATGFAVNRSFVEDDQLLVDALADRIRRCVRLRHEQPDDYRRLSRNAAATARRFSWDRCAEHHLAAFQPLYDGRSPTLSDDAALHHGWFDLLSARAWTERPVEIADRALALGDIEAYARTGRDWTEVAGSMFTAAYVRADFARCRQIAALTPPDTVLPGLEAVRRRCEVVTDPAGAPSWHLRYRLPHAERVQLVVPSVTGAGRAVPAAHELDRDGDSFTGSFPGAPPPAGPQLLLTLASGRITWDSINHE